jgi:uncharacterized RDD family membrane protein YckC
MTALFNSDPAAPLPPVWDAGRNGRATGYAGFLIRVLAGVIDGLVVGAISAGAIMVLASGTASDRFGAEFVVVSLFVGWLYCALLESSERGATAGKWLLGLRVIDDRGGRISFLRATRRYFSKFVSAIVLMIGFIMTALTDRKRALHDILAGTLVVRIR